LISELTRLVEPFSSNEALDHSQNQVLQTLGRCLADEAPARPETIRAALQQLVCFGEQLCHWDFTADLARGRYGRDFRETARKVYLESSLDHQNAGHALVAAVWWQTAFDEDDLQHTGKQERFYQLLFDMSSLTRCEGALGFIGLFTFEGMTSPWVNAGWIYKLFEPTIAMLFSDNSNEEYVAAWLLGLLGLIRVGGLPPEPDVMGRLFAIWRHSTNKDSRDMASWALARQPLRVRDQSQYCRSVSLEEIGSILDEFDNLSSRGKVITLIVAWYLRAISDADIAHFVQRLHIKRRHDIATDALMRLKESLSWTLFVD
jgi:hypothetical protein